MIGTLRRELLDRLLVVNEPHLHQILATYLHHFNTTPQDPHDRQAYQRLKRDLALQDWADMNAYATTKGPLITEITQRTEAWAQSAGWAPQD